ncbi:DUF1648 domain-containing protein [Microbacterium luticocti]|uniref:DUF1648 domain-containing protein n=1 Tax=Microbacterium luticocti TaxID=451764 RepID=UPI000417A32B|nr:DUF1648 domain-containing protein [Microbacterium luticocti]
MSAAVRRARRAFVWVGVVLPAAITLVSSVVIAMWLPQLPDPAATHWSGNGPDGFGPAWTFLVVGAGVPAAMIVLSTVVVAVAHRSGRTGPPWSQTARLLGATTLGLSAMMAVMMLSAVGVQRGLTDAAEAPEDGGWVLVGFAAMAAAGVAGWFLQPAVPPQDAARPGESAPLELAPDERAVWTAVATTGLAGRIVLAVVVLIPLVTAVLMWVGGESAWWITAVIGVVLLGLLATMLTFRVRASRQGLRVRSAAGWPRFEVPLDDIVAVRTVSVHPFAEFGGWGLRYGMDGRFGVVLRTGDGIEVDRRDGRRFVVTVDDAGTGAALLNGLREREASTPAADDKGDRTE